MKSQDIKNVDLDHIACLLTFKTLHGRSITGDGNILLSKNDIGIGNVDNTSDLNKGISTATQSALDLKANSSTLNLHINNAFNPHGVTSAQLGLGNVTNESKITMFCNPVFTGTPTSPTAASGTNTDQIATTAFVKAEVNNLINAMPGILDILSSLSDALVDDSNLANVISNELASKASLNSPVFTGNVSGISKHMVGLGSVDNTSDYDKPISKLMQSSLDGKANTLHIHDIDNISGLRKLLDSKQPTIIGASSTIVSNNLNPARVIVSDSSGKIAASTVTSNEIKYSSGLKDNIQKQLDLKLNSTGIAFGASKISAAKWVVEESKGDLYFICNGSNKAKLDSDGNLMITGKILSNVNL